MLPPLPEISIIIPTLNESAFIVECVESLLLGNYSTKRIELLIIDGGSTDDTVAKAEDLSRRYPSVKVLRNPMIIVPAAMNIGVRAASYDLLMWCGAHAIYDKDYVNLAVNTLLEESGAASVGGVISPIAKTATGKAIAIATSSKFGIGNAQYRYATTRQHVDTVFGGCFYKASIHKIGGFNQAWVRNQDYELNYRLRTQVGPIVLEPGIRCQYYCRESIAQLSKQYFAYGFWRFNTLKAHPSSFSYRQAAPILLCLGLLASAALILSGFNIGLVLPLVYILSSLATSLHLALKNSQLSLILRLPAIFAALHISWGMGFIKNALKTTITRFTPR